MRPIDADALPVCKEHCIDECGFGANFYVVHKTDIDAAPTITIEAAPVKHGFNVKQKACGDDAFECSICGYEDWDCMTCEPKHHNFCPNCGCKMDLEET